MCDAPNPHHVLDRQAECERVENLLDFAGAEIYKGQQITLRQFAPESQGGIFAKFSGNERVVMVPGEPDQLLAGTLSDGDRVDVVATTKYHVDDLARAASRVVLRNLLVLKAPDAPKAATVAGMRALGWEAGELKPGMLADFATVQPPRMDWRGLGVGYLIFCCSARDVTNVVVGGRTVVGKS